MCRSECEPSLDDVLSDPVIRALMQRDRVDAEALRAFLQSMSGSLAGPAPRQAATAAPHEWMTTLHERGRCMGERTRTR